MEFSRTLQELDMRVNGKWTSSMEGERRYLRKKAQFMKEIFMKARNMAREFSSGRMEVTIKETVSKANMRGADFTTLQIKAGNMKVIF